MGYDFSSGSVTDCLLRSFFDLKRQSELHYVSRLNEKQKQTEPKWMSSPINYPAYYQHSIGGTF